MDGPEVNLAMHSNIKYLCGGIVVRIAQVRYRFLLLQVCEKNPDPLVRCLYPNLHVNVWEDLSEGFIKNGVINITLSISFNNLL